MKIPQVIAVRIGRRRAERDYVELERVASHMWGAYQDAVEHDAPRQELAGILRGLAGCELVMAQLNPAMGWGLEVDEDGCTVGESARRAGLLLLEVASAAGDDEYRGVRAVELQCGVIAQALGDVAVAYRGWVPNPWGTHGGPGEPVPVGQRLGELWHAVVEVIGGRAAEVLAPLMEAHGHHPMLLRKLGNCRHDRCGCDKHGGHEVEQPCV
jgi:hypothetical protein